MCTIIYATYFGIYEYLHFFILQVCSHGMKHGLTLPSELDEDEGESVNKTGEKCKPCLYVDHFMLEELYVAVSEARTFANTDSIDTALGYVKNALDSIHLFHGYRPRVINQQIEMQKIAHTMYRKVAETKQDRTEGHLTIDWAMNWEPALLQMG